MKETSIKTKRSNKGKVAGVVALVALLATGTFAWSDMKQHKTNTAMGGGANSEVVLVDDFNPEDAKDWKRGVRLHKKVHVENKGEADVFVRIGLREYMEIGAGKDYNWSEERYMIDSEGNYLKAPSKEFLIQELNSNGIKFDEDNIVEVAKSLHDDVPMYYLKTQAGDINGQYGRHLELSVKEGSISDAKPVIPGTSKVEVVDHHADNAAEESYPLINFNKDNEIREYVEMPAVNYYSVDEFLSQSLSQVWISDGEYLYFSEAIPAKQATPEVVDGLKLIKNPEGVFQYDLHVSLEAVDRSSISTLEDMSPDVKEIWLEEAEPSASPFMVSRKSSVPMPSTSILVDKEFNTIFFTNRDTAGLPGARIFKLNNEDEVVGNPLDFRNHHRFFEEDTNTTIDNGSYRPLRITETKEGYLAISRMYADGGEKIFLTKFSKDLEYIESKILNNGVQLNPSPHYQIYTEGEREFLVIGTSEKIQPTSKAKIAAMIDTKTLEAVEFDFGVPSVLSEESDTIQEVTGKDGTMVIRTINGAVISVVNPLSEDRVVKEVVEADKSNDAPIAAMLDNGQIKVVTIRDEKLVMDTFDLHDDATLVDSQTIESVFDSGFNVYNSAGFYINQTRNKFVLSARNSEGIIQVAHLRTNGKSFRKVSDIKIGENTYKVQPTIALEGEIRLESFNDDGILYFGSAIDQNDNVIKEKYIFVPNK